MILSSKWQGIIYCLLIMMVAGCATVKPTHDPQAVNESDRDVVSAMEHVLTTVSGEKIDDHKLRELNRTIQKDPEAKSAVQSITHAVSGQEQVIKYCPIDGKRYSPKFIDCPVHGTPLNFLNE